MPGIAYGVDVSAAQYQGGNYFDYNSFYQAGGRFAIIKAGGSDGGLYMDRDFMLNYNAAKAAGIEVGIYWYTKAASVSDLVNNEIPYLISNITGLQFELPVFLDLEETSLASYCLQLAYAWNSAMLAADYWPGIYSMYAWFMDPNILQPGLVNGQLLQYSVWWAIWTNTEPSWPYRADFWQQGATYIGGIYTDYDWQYTDYSWIRNSRYNGWSGSSGSYTIRTTSPAGLNLPWYNTISVGGYNTSIIGNSASGQGEPGANVLNNCVGYSQGRMMEMYDQAVSAITSAADNPFYMFNANAEDWYQIAVNYSFPVGQHPAAGAVGVWYSPSQNVGHVANVETYDSNGWLISEGHWQHGGTYGSWDTTYLLSDYTLNWMDSSWQLIGFIYPFRAAPGPGPTPGPGTRKKLKPWMYTRRLPF